jgi:hypothetical protein
VIIFFEEVREIRELQKNYHDFWVVLVGDMITDDGARKTHNKDTTTTFLPIELHGP